MRKLHDFLAEDTNQFGPGTDLIVSLLAVLLVMITVSSYLYGQEHKRVMVYEEEKKEEAKRRAEQNKGDFEPATEKFPAGDFLENPVTKLADDQDAKSKVEKIIQQYKSEYPYIFVIGHASNKDALVAEDRSEGARLQRNWKYAGMRAAVIANLLQERLPSTQRDKIVILSTGEFDQKVPEKPDSSENAWVEVIFGKKWKLPASQSH